MSLQNPKAKRILSAKISSSNSRQRPFSGSAYSRNQLIFTTYAQEQKIPQRATSARIVSSKSKVIDDLQKSKKIVVKQSKIKEQLQIQILHLKKTINQLVEQLQVQKGRNQSLRKKGQKFNKLLTAEYENEVHWNSNTLNTHLIAGIKNQYENLKIKCEQLTRQNQKLRKLTGNTKQLQYIHYIQKLQMENKNLVERLKRQSLAGSAQMVNSNQSQKKAAEYVISELQNQNQKLYQRNSELKGKYKICRDFLKDKDNKIAILQKLIIEKENNYYALQKKQSNTRKQMNSTRQKLHKITQQHQLLQTEHQNKLQLFEQQIMNIEAKNGQKLNSTINEKNYKISSLERESLYFQNMVKELRSTNTQLNYQVQNAKANKQNQKQAPAVSHGQVEQKERLKKEQFANFQDNFNQEESTKKGIYENNRRVAQKANKKYSQFAMKKRKLTLADMQQPIQFLRLRILNRKMSIKTLISLLNARPQASQWEVEYITLRQVRQIFESQQLKLPSQLSLLLARYLIQDVNQQYVYCDQNNQNNRQIVKSILKNISGQADRIGGSTFRSEVEVVMKNYRDKIKKTLQTIQPSGYVSKKKFIQALRNIGVVCSSQAQDLLLAQLSQYSSSIGNLSYRQTYSQ